MKKVFSFLILSMLALSISSFSTKEKVKLKWITVAEFEVQYAKNPKPILVDLYTSWCGWCKVMDSKTYTNEKLAAYVNEHYYAIKFDAESKESITFNKKVYKYNAAYKIHELALFLSNGELSFPTTVFMSGINSQVAPIPGYMKVKDMEAPLKYFGDKAEATQTFVEFNKNLKKEW
jgi:thioredoxin-related protein